MAVYNLLNISILAKIPVKNSENRPKLLRNDFSKTYTELYFSKIDSRFFCKMNVMILKYYVKEPYNPQNFNSFSTGEIIEFHYFDEENAYIQTKTLQQRKDLVEKVRSLVKDKISKKKIKDYIWFRFDVYDDEANLLFSYHKFYNKKLLS